MNKNSESPKEIIVVGGGFAGINVVRGLKRAPVSIILVDKHNYHLFQPLLYQVAVDRAAAVQSPAAGSWWP